MPTKALLRRNLLHPTAVTAALLALSIALPARAADPASCRPVLDATRKQNSVSTHMYMTRTAPSSGGKPSTSEMIYVGGTSYIQVGDGWKRSTMTREAGQKVAEENIKSAKVISCRYLRDEMVGGEAAAVYSQHIENEDTVSDGTVWISKSRGLPLRVDTKVEDTQRSVRYEYGNVQAPAGVK
jgi:hypothetical protein